MLNPHGLVPSNLQNGGGFQQQPAQQFQVSYHNNGGGRHFLVDGGGFGHYANGFNQCAINGFNQQQAAICASLPIQQNPNLQHQSTLQQHSTLQHHTTLQSQTRQSTMQQHPTFQNQGQAFQNQNQQTLLQQHQLQQNQLQQHPTFTQHSQMQQHHGGSCTVPVPGPNMPVPGHMPGIDVNNFSGMSIANGGNSINNTSMGVGVLPLSEYALQNYLPRHSRVVEEMLPRVCKPDCKTTHTIDILDHGNEDAPKLADVIRNPGVHFSALYKAKVKEVARPTHRWNKYVIRPRFQTERNHSIQKFVKRVDQRNGVIIGSGKESFSMERPFLMNSTEHQGSTSSEGATAVRKASREGDNPATDDSDDDTLKGGKNLAKDESLRAWARRDIKIQHLSLPGSHVHADFYGQRKEYTCGNPRIFCQLVCAEDWNACDGESFYRQWQHPILEAYNKDPPELKNKRLYYWGQERNWEAIVDQGDALTLDREHPAHTSKHERHVEADKQLLKTQIRGAEVRRSMAEMTMPGRDAFGADSGDDISVHSVDELVKREVDGYISSASESQWSNTVTGRPLIQLGRSRSADSLSTVTLAEDHILPCDSRSQIEAFEHFNEQRADRRNSAAFGGVNALRTCHDSGNVAGHGVPYNPNRHVWRGRDGWQDVPAGTKTRGRHNPHNLHQHHGHVEATGWRQTQNGNYNQRQHWPNSYSASNWNHRNIGGDVGRHTSSAAHLPTYGNTGSEKNFLGNGQGIFKQLTHNAASKKFPKREVWPNCDQPEHSKSKDSFSQWCQNRHSNMPTDVPPSAQNFTSAVSGEAKFEQTDNPVKCTNETGVESDDAGACSNNIDARIPTSKSPDDPDAHLQGECSCLNCTIQFLPKEASPSPTRSESIIVAKYHRSPREGTPPLEPIPKAELDVGKTADCGAASSSKSKANITTREPKLTRQNAGLRIPAFAGKAVGVPLRNGETRHTTSRRASLGSTLASKPQSPCLKLDDARHFPALEPVTKGKANGNQQTMNTRHRCSTKTQGGTTLKTDSSTSATATGSSTGCSTVSNVMASAASPADQRRVFAGSIPAISGVNQKWGDMNDSKLQREGYQTVKGGGPLIQRKPHTSFLGNQPDFFADHSIKHGSLSARGERPAIDKKNMKTPCEAADAIVTDGLFPSRRPRNIQERFRRHDRSASRASNRANAGDSDAGSDRGCSPDKSEARDMPPQGTPRRIRPPQGPAPITLDTVCENMPHDSAWRAPLIQQGSK